MKIDIKYAFNFFIFLFFWKTRLSPNKYILMISKYVLKKKKKKIRYILLKKKKYLMGLYHNSYQTFENY